MPPPQARLRVRCADGAALLCSAADAAQALLDQWKAGEATEDSFAALAQTDSDDTGSAEDGGLIADISASSGLVQPFKDWALEPGRQPGDTGLVESDYGWHIMYYVGDGEPDWILNATYGADAALRAESYEAWQEEATQDYEPVAGMGLRFVEG